MNPPPSIVIREIGILSPLGLGFEEFSPALMEGEAPEPDPETQALCLPEYLPRDFLPTPKTYLDPNSAAVMTAAALAQNTVPPVDRDVPGERIGMLMSTTGGNHATMMRFFDDVLRKGPRLVKPMLFQHAYMNSSISLACMEWGWKGPHLLHAGEAPAALQSLLDGADLLRDGAADILFIGAADVLERAAKELPPPRAERIPSEGAVVLRMKRAEAGHASGRSPGLVLAGGASGGAAPAPEPCAAALRDIVGRALADAGKSAGPIDAILIAASADNRLEASLAAALKSLFPPATPVAAPDVLYGVAGAVDGLLLVATAAAILENRTFPPLPLPEVFRAAGFSARPGTEAFGEGGHFLLIGADRAGAVTAIVLAA